VNVLVFVLIVAILAAAVAVVSAPLRSRSRGGQAAGAEGERSHSAGLAAARDAKYQEIRDAELDFRTGKLSPDDYQRIDASLRAEALEILDRIDEQEGNGEPPPRA
jgi:hypothetical protein